jgi:hypothetical protein
MQGSPLQFTLGCGSADPAATAEVTRDESSSSLAHPVNTKASISVIMIKTILFILSPLFLIVIIL